MLIVVFYFLEGTLKTSLLFSYCYAYVLATPPLGGSKIDPIKIRFYTTPFILTHFLWVPIPALFVYSFY